MATSATTILLSKPSSLERRFLNDCWSQNPTKTYKNITSYKRVPKKLVINSISSPASSSRMLGSSSSLVDLLVKEFDPSIPFDEAITPPSSWYSDPAFFSLEFDRVFYKGWQVVGYSDQIKDRFDYFTGSLGHVEFVVCRDSDENVRAFHNVCRHRASLLASGSGKKSCFVCPYHGWTYGLDGGLLKATKITGTQNFELKDFGLVPLKVAIWGPFVLVNFDKSCSEIDCVKVGRDWLGSCTELIKAHATDAEMSFVSRREYTMDCNWKVFCDNYLDGGYHVPYAHRDYTSEVNYDTYCTEIFDRVTIQTCKSSSVKPQDGFDRLGSEALYAFIFPNFIFERYGPWMSTNLIIPLGPRKCKVVFDFFLDSSLKENKAFIEKSIETSDHIQVEDIVLCESVQRGLESPAYGSGRYVASVEKAVHHFHCLLQDSLT